MPKWTKFRKITEHDWGEICAHTYEILEDNEYDPLKAKDGIIRYHREMELSHAQHQHALKSVAMVAISSYKELSAQRGDFDLSAIHEKQMAEKAASLWSESSDKEYIADYKDGSVELPSNETIYVQ